MTNVFITLTPGVRYMLLSALGFALMAVCVKAAALEGIPVFEIVAARCVVSIFLSYADIKRKNLSVWGHNKPLLLARGGIGAFALICVYYSVTTLPLAEATMLQYTYPAFTALIALWFLKERIQGATIVCIVMSLAGVIVMVRPDLNQGLLTSLPSLSIVAALLGALGSAIAYVLVRKLSASEDASVIIFYFPLVALPISIVLLGNSFIMPTLYGWVLLLLVGLFTQVGQLGLTKAMSTEKAGKAAAYAYVQVIFSALLGWAFFAEVPTLFTLLGGGLIIAGALINTWYRR